MSSLLPYPIFSSKLIAYVWLQTPDQPPCSSKSCSQPCSSPARRRSARTKSSNVKLKTKYLKKRGRDVKERKKSERLEKGFTWKYIILTAFIVVSQNLQTNVLTRDDLKSKFYHLWDRLEHHNHGQWLTALNDENLLVYGRDHGGKAGEYFLQQDGIDFICNKHKEYLSHRLINFA